MPSSRQGTCARASPRTTRVSAAKPSTSAKLASRDLVEGAWRQHVLDRSRDFLAPACHAEGRDLHRGRVAEHVHHQPGQAIAFAVHQPVRGGFRARQGQDGPQVPRRAQPADEEGSVNRLVGPGEQANRDLRARVVDAAADEAAVVIDQRDHASWLGLAVDVVDGVGVDPRMAEPQRTGPPSAQHDLGGRIPLRAAGGWAGHKSARWALLVCGTSTHYRRSQP